MSKTEQTPTADAGGKRTPSGVSRRSLLTGSAGLALGAVTLQAAQAQAQTMVR